MSPSNESTMVCVLWSQLVPTVQLVFILAFSFVVPPGNSWCNHPMVLLQHDEVRYIPTTSDSQYKNWLSTHAVHIVWWKLEWHQCCMLHIQRVKPANHSMSCGSHIKHITFRGLHIQKSLQSSLVMVGSWYCCVEVHKQWKIRRL